MAIACTVGGGALWGLTNKRHREAPHAQHQEAPVHVEYPHTNVFSFYFKLLIFFRDAIFQLVSIFFQIFLALVNHSSYPVFPLSLLHPHLILFLPHLPFFHIPHALALPPKLLPSSSLAPWPLLSLSPFWAQKPENLDQRSTKERKHVTAVFLCLRYLSQWDIFQFHQFVCYKVQ